MTDEQVMWTARSILMFMAVTVLGSWIWFAPHSFLAFLGGLLILGTVIASVIFIMFLLHLSGWMD